MQPGHHGLEVVLVAPSTFVAQAAQRWFGAKETLAAKIRGVLTGGLGFSSDCQHGACHPCSPGQFSPTPTGQFCLDF